MAAKSRRGGLGKGLGALIPTQAEERPRLGDAAADVIIGKVPGEATENAAASSTPQEGEIETVSPADFGARLHDLPVAEIAPNPQQPRTYFAEEELAELAHSIKEIGLLQPIVVRHAPAGSERPYELIMGERRLRASEQAGLETITAIVRETEDEFLLRDALLENIHRVQLNPLEEAAAYQQLLEEFSVTQAELARKIGRSRPVIANCIRLLNLPVDVQQSVAAGVLSAGHARALLGLEGGESVQIALAQRIVAEGLSVRTTEEAVTLLNAGGTAGQVERATRTTRQQPAIFDSFATSLSDALDTRVLVSMGKRKGKIVVEFSDVADFERIMDQLGRTPGN